MAISWMKIVQFGGGSAVRGTVHTKNVAKVTKTPIKEIKGAVSKAKKTGMSKAYSGMSRRKGADVTGTPGANLKAALLAAYGPGPKGGQVNIGAAAADLNVSPSTIKRWMNNKSTPMPENLKALLAKSRKAASTKQGRSTAVKELKASTAGTKMQKYGGELTVSGIQGPEGYERDRTVTFHLTPELVDEALTAYEAHGDVGLADFMGDYADSDNYGNLDDWNVWNFGDVGFEPKKA